MILTPDHIIILATLAAEFIITLVAIRALSRYRINKKHKNDKAMKMGFWKSLFNFFDKNIVELTYFGVLVPNWTLIVELFNK